MFSLIVACCWLMTRSRDGVVVGMNSVTGGESIWTSRVTVSASAKRRLCRHKVEL
jgi:hypothetical protein